jgi:alkanesulfonate monooxygenase SsuD/methylene tetrahydromethanopterin reductase-like flavin-dependent oxidoreductase (luciferase family)
MATLDHISDGRAELGVGRGTFPNVHEGFNVSFEESRSRFDEFLEVVVTAWTQESFSFDGEHFSCEDLTVTPRPYQQPHPPITIGVTSAESFPIVGSMGRPLIVNPSRVFTLDQLAEHTAAYRKAWQDAGHPGEGKIGLRVPIYVNEDAERAYLDPKESAMHSMGRLGERVGSYAGRAGTTGDWAEQSRIILGMDYDDWLRDKVVYGTPDQVTQRLAELEETLGLDQCIYEINYGNLMPDEMQTTSLRLFNKKVLPKLLTNGNA